MTKLFADIGIIIISYEHIKSQIFRSWRTRWNGRYIFANISGKVHQV